MQQDLELLGNLFARLAINLLALAFAIDVTKINAGRLTPIHAL